jgi:flagellar protein FliO/FliZ
LGGEKLKAYRPYWHVFLIYIFIFISFFVGIAPSFAQTEDLLSDPLAPESISEAVSAAVADSTRVDETTIFLGEGPDLPVATGDSSVFVIIRMVLVLALAALAIYGVVFFIKRLARPQESLDPHLKVLARLPLSNDSYAAVISVGTKAWLVCGAPGSVSLISEIDDKESLETMLLDEANRAAAIETRQFIDFRTLISRFGPQPKQKKQSNPTGFHAEILRKQQERVRGL